jgi:hypothetical protein
LVHSSANIWYSKLDPTSNTPEFSISFYFPSGTFWHRFAPSLGIISHAIGQACARTGLPFEGWGTKPGKNGHGTSDVELFIAIFFGQNILLC